VHQVHARWIGAGRAVHRGPTVARTKGTAARSPELVLRPLRCMEARRRGRNREREAWGTQLGPHRGLGGAEEAGRWRCRTGRQWRSVRGLLRWGEREIGAGRGAVKLGEGAHLLLGPGERWGGVAGAVNAGVNGFNAIEDGPA
jgi:hypothetical protein